MTKSLKNFCFDAVGNYVVKIFEAYSIRSSFVLKSYGNICMREKSFSRVFKLFQVTLIFNSFEGGAKGLKAY